MNSETPIAYLWRQLETLLSEPALDLLRKNYAAHKHAYERPAKIRGLRRELDTLCQCITTHSPNSPRYWRYAKKITRCRARIRALEDEENVIDNT